MNGLQISAANSLIPPNSPPLFHSILGRQIPPDKLRLFSKVLTNLRSVYHFNRGVWEDNFLEWMNVYSRLFHSALHLSSNDIIEYASERDESRRGYQRVLTGYNHHAISHPNLAQMPTFEELRDEVVELYDEFDYTYTSPFRNHECKLCHDIAVYGKEVRGNIAYALAFASCVSVEYAQMVRSLMHRLPFLIRRPTNYPEAYRVNGTTEVGFPVLTDVVAVIEPHRETALMSYFGPLLALTVDLFTLTNYNPTVAQIHFLQDQCANVWKYLIAQSFETPFSLRVHMANTNLRGIIDALVHQCFQYLRLGRTPNTLGWLLHAWFFLHLHDALLACNRDWVWARTVIIWLSYDRFDPYTRYPQPILNYRHPRFRVMRLSADRLRHANPAPDMPEVEFVPDGPPFNPAQFTTPVTQYNKKELCVICQCEFDDDTVVRIPCGHLLHLECVRNMINRVEPSSNLCPLDRTEICPPRPSRPQL